MSISAEEREQLHYRLDALINMRLRLERAINGQQDESIIHDIRAEMLENGLDIVFTTIGNRGYFEFPDEIDNEIIQMHIGASLVDWARLISTDNGWKEVLWRAAQEVRLLSVGELPSLFSSAKRAPGLHKQWFSLMSNRCGPFVWDAVLQEKGVPLFERRQSIESAYRTVWDTIRKWKGPIKKYLGDDWVKIQIDDALHHLADSTLDDAYAQLERAGDAYWKIYTSDYPQSGNPIA